MKNNIYLILFALISVSSCKKGDVLYSSPDAPEKVTPQVMLTSIEVNTIQNTEGDLARVAAVYSDQIAGISGQYTYIQDYDLKTLDFDNHWVGLYATTMGDCKIMIDKYSATDPAYAGIAQILMALNLGIATDLWGDVPYSEAFQGQNGVFTAKYDAQADVIASIQSLLDQGIANLAKPDNIDIPGSDDLYYGGLADKWIKAAWTLKARYANRVSLKDPNSAANVLAYLANGITNPADNMENPHPAATNTQNQWGAFAQQAFGYMVANKFFIDALMDPAHPTDATKYDPRLDYYFRQDTADYNKAPLTTSKYTGSDIADEIGNPDASTVGKYFGYLGPDSDLVAKNFPVITSFEASFLAAEAKSRLGQDASADLNAGIKASVKYVTGGANDGSSIATYTQATATLTNIMTQKWIAMFGQIEAYNDVRRTGIPVLQVRPGSAGAKPGGIPQRLPTPQNEIDGNPANAKVIPLTTPVWWATH